MDRLSKSIMLTVVLTLAAGLCHAAAVGGFQPGIRLGTYEDSEDAFVGVDARFGVLMLNANPSIEYVFVDEGTMMTFNADASVNVLSLPLVSGWVGGGMGLMYFDPEAGDSSSDPLFNLVAGVGLGVPLSPYLMAKWVFSDHNDGFVIAVGIRF